MKRSFATLLLACACAALANADTIQYVNPNQTVVYVFQTPLWADSNPQDDFYYDPSLNEVALQIGAFSSTMEVATFDMDGDPVQKEFGFDYPNVGPIVSAYVSPIPQSYYILDISNPFQTGPEPYVLNGDYYNGIMFIDPSDNAAAELYIQDSTSAVPEPGALVPFLLIGIIVTIRLCHAVRCSAR